IEIFDLEFLDVAVLENSAGYRDELIKILKTYPSLDRLADGPSYIEVGAEIGDQTQAFRLFALGKKLKLWDIVTPKLLGMTGEEAREMAGRGFIMITGFNPKPE